MITSYLNSSNRNSNSSKEISDDKIKSLKTIFNHLGLSLTKNTSSNIQIGCTK